MSIGRWLCIEHIIWMYLNVLEHTIPESFRAFWLTPGSGWMAFFLAPKQVTFLSQQYIDVYSMGRRCKATEDGGTDVTLWHEATFSDCCSASCGGINRCAAKVKQWHHRKNNYLDSSCESSWLLLWFFQQPTFMTLSLIHFLDEWAINSKVGGSSVEVFRLLRLRWPRAGCMSVGVCTPYTLTKWHTF